MTRTFRNFMGACVLLGGAALLYLAFASGRDPGEKALPQTEAGSSLASSGKVEQGPGTASDPRANPNAKSPRRAAMDDAPRLVLEVQDREGNPLSGKLYVRHSRSAPLTSEQLAPELGTPVSEDVKVLSYRDGRCELEIPRDHWTWLRVTDSEPVPTSSYRRLPSFSGLRREKVILDPASRRLHAFVLRQDLLTPAAQCRVTLYQSDLRLGGPLATVASARADEMGYCTFEGLGPGAYLLTAGSARPDDGPPWACRLILPPGTSFNELPCTLVEAPERIPVSIEVRARIEKRTGRDVLPRLYFVPASGKGEVVVSPITLSAGVQRFDVMLREGIYESRVLPMGELHVDGGMLSVTKDGESDFSLSVADASTRTKVELRGLSRTDLPVHVRMRQPGAVIHGREDELFAGPYTWYQNTETIRSTDPNPVQLVVSKRHRFWVSRRMVSLTGGEVSAELVPAARLHVELPLGGEGACRTGHATVNFADQSLWLALLPSLVQRSGRSLPALVGAVVVPIGPVRIVGFDRDTGKQLWERSFEAKRAREILRVDS